MSVEDVDVPQGAAEQSSLRRTVVAASIGNFVEWYEFAVVLGWYREPEPDRASMLVGSER